MIPAQSITVYHMKLPDTATGGVLWEKVILENSQILQENTYARVSFLIK